MIRTGLLSVTFRQLVVEDIIPLVVQAGLDGIEWGGDIHVPHGEVKRAEVVGRLTRDAGLQVGGLASRTISCSLRKRRNKQASRLGWSITGGR
jgi:3-dehydroshikimate dehydratase